MARPYGQKFLLALNRSKADTLGVELARLCVKANIPATLVAVVLDTSSTTVYAWFRGQGIRERKRKVVEAFINLLKNGLESGDLPVSKADDAAKFISTNSLSANKKR